MTCLKLMETTTNAIPCVVSLHFKYMKLLNKTSELEEITDQLKLKVSMGSNVAYIKTQRCSQPGLLIMNNIQHLQAEISQDQRSSNNNLLLQLTITSRLVPDHSTLVGQSHTHVQLIAAETPFTAMASLLSSENEAVATVQLDCSLNYGIFGFGESAHLHVSHKDREKSLRWTTFPRLTPPTGTSDTQGLRIVPLTQDLCHPTFIPFHIKATTYSAAGYTNKQVPNLAASMTKLAQWRLQCSAIRDRSKKLEFLEQLTKTDSHVSSLSEEPGITSRPN